jgi:hypothetical protein
MAYYEGETLQKKVSPAVAAIFLRVFI